MICNCFLPFTQSKKKPCPDLESDDEIQIHGTAAKEFEPKAAEEDSLTRLSNLHLRPLEMDTMEETQEKQKAAECSVNQLDEKSSKEEETGIPTLEHLMKNLLHVDEVIKLIELTEDERMFVTEPDEDSEEEEEEEEEDSEEEEEEVYGVCHVCLKDKEHSTFECPYLDCIPDPKNTTIGEDYFLVCKECGKLGGHPEEDWEGRALPKPVEFMPDYKPDGYEELMKLHPVKYVSFF